jgi:hypothetical protein
MKQERRTFMEASELKRLRKEVLRCSQLTLASQLLSPTSGAPIHMTHVSRWERGERPIPLWAARYIEKLVSAARDYDRTVQEDEE